MSRVICVRGFEDAENLCMCIFLVRVCEESNKKLVTTYIKFGAKIAKKQVWLIVIILKFLRTFYEDLEVHSEIHFNEGVRSLGKKS